MPSRKAERVLREIFDDFVGYKGWDQPSWPVLHATYDDLVALAELLANDAGEEELQRFLTAHPQLIIGALGSGGYGNELAFLTKQIGTQYRADFGFLSYGQGGGDITLIEIERSSDALFTRAGTPARRLQSAMGQVRAWDAWIRQNQPTFVQDILERCKQLPVYPRRSKNGSFLFMDFSRLESRWNHFGGQTNFPVRYWIIIGRWSRLSESDRSKLIYANRHDNSVHQVRTFEQLARSAHLSRMTRRY